MSKLTLYVFGPAFGLPDMSPFVAKTMVLLKMAQLEYSTSTRGYKHAPKGKLPYLRDDDQLIADSTFIRWHIEQKYQLDLDAGLSAAERGIAWAFEKMIEEHLYWAVLRERWLKEANYRKGPWQFFQRLSWPLRALVPAIVRRKMARSLQFQGLGRHSEAEILRLAQKSFDALADFLADKNT